jgi:uncharacterized protein YbgA (DUF1722 family)/uncharacterized protein YbbK (DUF523 family)
MNEKTYSIPIGISTCLLGEKVRYDGGHRLDRFLRDTLGQYVEYVPVCPETECGLSIPREAMHLVGDISNPRLVTIKSGTDYTERMKLWGRDRLNDLADHNLCGYIFKSRSPSSGMERIKVYTEEGRFRSSNGVGIWARMVMDRFPLLPVEDEGRLQDPLLREKFIERIFVHHRWRESLELNPTPRALVDFHTRHKLLIMSHSPKHYRELGRIVARVGESGVDLEMLTKDYHVLLTSALSLTATIKKQTNVLHHVMGYFKRLLSPNEKQELVEVINSYHNGYVPLIVPVTLLNHYVRKYDQSYLRDQVYLNPHPLELKLRTHV